MYLGSGSHRVLDTPSSPCFNGGMETTTTQYTATICFHIRPNRWVEADNAKHAQEIARNLIPGCTVEDDGIGGFLLGVDSDTAERIEDGLLDGETVEFVEDEAYMVQIEAS